jgi:hypothetical protein
MSGPDSDRSSSLQRPIDLLRERLAQAGISESALIRWLKGRGAIPPRTPGLQCISPRRLKIILDQWESVREQLL